MKTLANYINEAYASVEAPKWVRTSTSDELNNIDDKEHGFEYVDLGLPSGTMWATCNVGATKPEDPGLLFEFGRVDGYKYGDKNNQFRTIGQNLEDTGSIYIPQTISGNVYKRNEILDLEDDAAHVNMGGKWRMPTNDQLEELLNNTTHEVETINGIKGMMFISKINNKRLFVPFAGYDYGKFYQKGSYISIWSSQVYASDVNGAYRLNCNSSGRANISYNYRSYAFSVRGVFKK